MNRNSITIEILDLLNNITDTSNAKNKLLKSKIPLVLK